MLYEQIEEQLVLTPKATGRKQGGYDVFTAGPLADVLRVRKIAFPTSTGARAAYAGLRAVRLGSCLTRPT